MRGILHTENQIILEGLEKVKNVLGIGINTVLFILIKRNGFYLFMFKADFIKIEGRTVVINNDISIITVPNFVFLDVPFIGDYVFISRKNDI